MDNNSNFKSPRPPFRPKSTRSNDAYACDVIVVVVVVACTPFIVVVMHVKFTALTLKRIAPSAASSPPLALSPTVRRAALPQPHVLIYCRVKKRTLGRGIESLIGHPQPQ